MSVPFLLFMHIPKAAGTTLRSILDLQYGRKNVITYYNQPNAQLLENLDFLLRASRHDYKTLIGHFGFGVHKNLSRSASYVTFLREPVSRAISSYYEYVKRGTSGFFDEQGNAIPLPDYLAANEEFFANQQIKMIIGNGSFEPVDEADLEQTFQNIDEHFAFVGTSEMFNASVLLIAKMLGWTPCVYGQLNTGRKRPSSDPGIVQKLSELNSLEIRLYEKIKQKLEETLDSQSAAFHDALAELNDITNRIAEDTQLTQEAHEPKQLLEKLTGFLSG